MSSNARTTMHRMLGTNTEENLEPSYPARHRVVNSTGTNVSANADSTISFEGLNDFPQPPSSVPRSPGSTEFSRFLRNNMRHWNPMSGTSLTSTIEPSHDPRSDQATLLDSSVSFRQQNREVRAPATATSFTSQNSLRMSAGLLSPYDWHEGSSSIDVDSNDPNLLPTSFITSLLSSQNTDGGSDTEVSSHLFGTQNNRGVRNSFATGQERYATDASSPARPQITSTKVPLGALYWAEGLKSHYHDTTHDSVSGHSDPQQSQPWATTTVSVGSRTRTRGVSLIGPRLPRSAGSSTMSGITSMASSVALIQGSGNNRMITEDYVGEREADPIVLQPKRSAHANTSSPVSLFQQSISSTQTTVSSLLKRVSRNPTRFTWSSKPLPPVPDNHRFFALENPERRKEEETLPLPQLANRAEKLSEMLEKGHRPYTAYNNIGNAPTTGQYNIRPEPVRNREWGQNELSSVRSWRWSRDGKPQRLVSHETETHDIVSRSSKFTWRNLLSRDDEPKTPVLDCNEHQRSSSQPSKFAWLNVYRFSRVRVGVVVAALIVIIVVAVVVGVVVGRKKQSSGLKCTTNTTGGACDLDSTCVCSSSSTCVARSLVTLVPTVNQLFNANLSVTDIATALWNTQDISSPGNCTSQAILVDVGPALRVAPFPNRTTWARSALLWQVVLSMDLASVAKMQSFVKNTDFSALSQDGPEPDPSSKFSITNLGFRFDFAAQTVSDPPVSWESVGQPSGAQLSRVGNIAGSALDRMYSSAVASSTQQQAALANYWNSALQQDPQTLKKFLSIVSSSPIVIPFDATLTSGGQALDSLLTQSASHFPPPIACYPSLDSSQVALINQVEEGIFGLSPASARSTFDTSCYGDRPVYGILDMLRLRLPFADSRNVTKQGVVLVPEVSPRAVAYSGETLAALPHDPNNTRIILAPLQYGTLNNLNHVMLRYLSSIPDTSVAVSFVQFVLSSPTLPPTNTSTLFNALSSLPALEVAVFGNITSSDVSYVVSSFSTPSGGIFFGSDASAALRDWAVGGIGSYIAWAETWASPDVVHDALLNDSNFMSVWNPAFQYLHTSNPGVLVTVSNITNSFQSIRKFSPH